jgi:hypothetical protein
MAHGDHPNMFHIARVPLLDDKHQGRHELVRRVHENTEQAKERRTSGQAHVLGMMAGIGWTR